MGKFIPTGGGKQQQAPHGLVMHLVPKWRRSNVDATSSRRIDVNTMSFYVMCPLGRTPSSHPFSQFKVPEK